MREKKARMFTFVLEGKRKSEMINVDSFTAEGAKEFDSCPIRGLLMNTFMFRERLRSCIAISNSAHKKQQLRMVMESKIYGSNSIIK